ncbi:hypothetical protein SISSUDRAFT_1058665 [Sistotremastrum suecicum HHB10207 ss-3]|uniref:Carbohydrate-binding module family 1 protein n=1 Tax=Sistotremastrum suecicum HHB10207 ss-3 TaxID=1314776 RepID=A0A166H3J3_9AGAM|nr:hypothetical protein SISSUDRAFT_1058665 [Sistotremastrum suecicum HHB10207 ss-3]
MVSAFIVLCVFSWLTLQVEASFRNSIYEIQQGQQISGAAQRLADLAAAVSSVPASVATPLAFGSAPLPSATVSFQIYQPSNLPTAPAPPTACANALTAGVGCNATIQLLGRYPATDLGTLSSICTPICNASLAAYRSNVVSACGGYQIPGPNNVSYAPTLAVDTISGPYHAQCVTDTTSGNYCGPTLSTYSSQSGILGYSSTQRCTSCLISTLGNVLLSPLTYSTSLLSTFQSVIASCGSVPSSSTMFSRGSNFVDISSNATSAFACSNINGRTVSLSGSATCSSIAGQYSVSQADIQINNPTITSTNCNTGIASGTSLCLPQKCVIFTVPSKSTCSSVVNTVNTQGIAGQNITVGQLLSFNPELGSGCSNIGSRVGTTICVSPHGGFPPLATAPFNIVRPDPIYTASVAPPSPTASGSTSACAAWYAVKSGDQCNRVLLNNAITLDDFLAINTGVNYNCSNLVTGSNYCVAPYPPLSSAGGAVPTLTANYTSATIYSSALPTPTSSDVSYIPYPTAYVPVPSNAAPGTITGCSYFYTVVSNDTCPSVETAFNITSTQFQQWNPTVAAGCDSLPVGEAVCVLVATNYTSTTSTSSTTTISSTTTSTSTTSSSSSVSHSSTSTTTAPTATQTKYGQCGGTGWTGPTVCTTGTTCTVLNSFYSQCL